MSVNNVNGRVGVKWITIVPLVVIIVGGGITWGENRLTTATNVADIKELEETHASDVELLREGQEDIADQVNDVVTEQRVIQNDIEHIKDSQDRQEDMTKRIFDALGSE